MSAKLYPNSLAAVLKHEGGKVDHPKDPGGRTNQGVIQRVYDGFRIRKGLAKRDVWLMSNAERDEIYRVQYWDVIKGDDLPPGIDYAVFDGSVNSGASQSAKWLQRALGVRDDGIIGPATLAAVWAVQDHDKLIADMLNRRMGMLRALRTWGTFGKGWTNRVNGVRQTAQQWARGSVGPAVVATGYGVSAKANIEDARALPSGTASDVAVGGGSILGAVGVALEGARDALTPLAGTSQLLNGLVAALVVVGAGVAIGGIVWRLHQKRKAAETIEALGFPGAA